MGDSPLLCLPLGRAAPLDSLVSLASHIDSVLAVLPSPQLQRIPCPAQYLACLFRKCLVEERRKRRRERAQAVLQVLLRKERSYGLESGWRHLLRESGTSGLVMWYKVSSPTVAAGYWTQDFPLRISEMTECLGDVADLLLWERFHSSEKKSNCAENANEAMSIQYVLNPKEENDCYKQCSWNTGILGHSHQAFY